MKLKSLLSVLTLLCFAAVSFSVKAFSPVEGKQYLIKNVTHDKYLDNSSANSNTQAILADKNASSLSQRFVFEAQTGDYAGSYKIKQVSSGNYLRRSGGANFNNDTQGQAYFQVTDKWTDNFPVTIEESATEGQYYMDSKYNGTAATNTNRYFFYHTSKSWVRSWCEKDAADLWAFEEAAETVEPTQLQSAISVANTFLASITSNQVPVSEETVQAVGQYSYSLHQAFVNALAAANAYLASTSEYYATDVTTHTTAIENAYNAFKASKLVVIVSENGATTAETLASGLYYIKVNGYYITAPNEALTTGKRKEVYFATRNEGNNRDNQVWNVQYSTTQANPVRYTFTSCVEGSTWTVDSDEETSVLGHITDAGGFSLGNTAYAQSTDANNHLWRNFSVYYDGTAYCFWNLRPSGNGGNLSLNIVPTVNGENITTTVTQSTVEKSYLYTFEPYIPTSTNIDTELAEQAVSVHGGVNAIIIGSDESAEIYDLSGRLVKSGIGTITVEKGLYVVKVVGQVFKVIVK